MALDLPNSPTTGQTFSDGTRTWQYDGAKWNLIRSSGVTTTIGDIIYADTASSTARRGIGTTGQVLTVAGGVPVWGDKPWNTPWGIISYVERATTNQTGITTTADVTGLTTTFTAVANRLYKTSVFIPDAAQITSAGLAYFFINAGGSIVNRWAANMAAGELCGVHMVYLSAPGAGSFTHKAQASTSAGTLTIYQTASERCYIMVEDIGPIGAPA